MFQEPNHMRAPSPLLNISICSVKIYHLKLQHGIALLVLQIGLAYPTESIWIVACVMDNA